ncbi:MAG: EamA family transporter [Deltaproteobacteria bacterium]|nr:EamA family transporter [Deltaproteobacteria bacterium]
MAPISIILVILSAAIHVGWNFLTKSSDNPKVFSLLKGATLMPLSLVALMIIPVRSVSYEIWAYIFFSGIIHAVYILALSSAYEVGDMSYVYPIARSAPAFVPIAAFLTLGETISIRGSLGIAIVVTGVFFLQVRGQFLSEPRKLMFSLKQKDSIWAFVTLGAVVTYTIIDKAAMVAMSRITEIKNGFHAPVFFILQYTVCYLLFGLYLGFRHELKIRPVLRKEWPLALIAAIGTMISYSLILHVMQTENVSYIVTLRQSSVLLAVLTGWKALKEPYGKYRLLVAFCMLFGFFLVATC